jgi:hypothetical protein
MNQYTDEPTADELAEEEKRPAWWRRLSHERRRQIGFVATGLVLYLLIGGGAVGFAASYGPRVSELGLLYLAVLLAPWILPLIQVYGAYGPQPDFDDDWEVKRPSLMEFITSLGLVGLMPYRREEERKHRRVRVRLAKETREWDYAPQKYALRVWQSRTHARTRFESTDLLLLRRTNDLAVQEAFLQCLEEAGIDTTEFREGAALINNYGIINQSGRIEGGARVTTTNGTSSGESKETRPPKARHKAAKAAAGAG